MSQSNRLEYKRKALSLAEQAESVLNAPPSGTTHALSQSLSTIAVAYALLSLDRDDS